MVGGADFPSLATLPSHSLANAAALCKAGIADSIRFIQQQDDANRPGAGSVSAPIGGGRSPPNTFRNLFPFPREQHPADNKSNTMRGSEAPFEALLPPVSATRRPSGCS